MDIYDTAVESYAREKGPAHNRDWFTPPRSVERATRYPVMDWKTYTVHLDPDRTTVADLHTCFDQLYNDVLAGIATEEADDLRDQYSFIDPVFDYTITFGDNDGHISYNFPGRHITVDTTYQHQIDPRVQDTYTDTFRGKIRHEAVHNLHHNERPDLATLAADVAEEYDEDTRKEQFHDSRMAPMEAITMFEEHLYTGVDGRQKPPLNDPWMLPDFFHDRMFLSTHGDDWNTFTDSYELGYSAALARYRALQQKMARDTALEETRKHVLYEFREPVDLKLSLIDSIHMLDVPNYPYRLAMMNARIHEEHSHGQDATDWLNHRYNNITAVMANATTEAEALDAYTSARALHDVYIHAADTTPDCLTELDERITAFKNTWRPD